MDKPEGQKKYPLVVTEAYDLELFIQVQYNTYRP